MRSNYPHHLAGFSYVGRHRYSLTFCTYDRQPHFTDAETVALVEAQFLRASTEQPFALIAYVYMPDHVHIVAEGTEAHSDLKDFVKRAKQYSGYYWMRSGHPRLWQRYGHEHVLRDDESTRKVVAYILENPLRAALAASVYDYPFIGSTVYTRDQLIEWAYRSR
jgi:REP element-mobilizing transposase RayT